MMKRLIETIKFWLRVRRANKNLLKAVAAHRDDPKYDPPTREQLLTFIHEGNVGSHTFGPIRFQHAMSYEPKRPYYTFPKE